MIGRGRTVVAGAGTVRGLNALLALLYLTTAGLIAYFRLVPVRRVMDRLSRDGVHVPGWFPLVFTIGPLIVGAYLVFQGGRYLRRTFAALAPGPRGD